MQNRVAVGFGLVLAALLANAALAGWNVARIRRNDRAVAHSHAVLAALDNLLAAVQGAETGQRGYLLTGRPEYLQPYHDALAELGQRLTGLRDLAAADQGPTAERLGAEVRQKLAELEETIRLHDRDGPAAALAVVLTGRGKRSMDRLRAEVEKAKGRERELLARRARESGDSEVVAYLSLGAAAALGLALLGFVWFLVRRDRAERERSAAERVRLLARLEAERAFLEAVLQQMPGGVLITEAPSGRVLLRNERAALPMQGPERPPPASLDDYGRYQDLFPDPRYPRHDRWPLLRALTAGEVVTGEEMEYLRPDGSRGTIRVNAAPVRDRDGRIVAAMTTFLDVSEAKRAEEAVRFLAEAGAVLGASLDYEAALADLARLVVPRLADWCGVHVLEEDGTLRQLAVAHIDPSKVELAKELAARYPPDPNAPTGVPAVVRSGQSALVPEVTDEMLVRGARDAEHLEVIRGLGLRSYMAVPLLARGRALGALSFVASGPGRRYGPDDLALAEEVGRCGGLAVDNARLYREAREADRRKDEFLAMLSHELRNPLAPVRNAVEVLKLRGPDPETVGWARAVVERQVQHLARLVDDLLDASRITRKKVRLRPVRLDLAALVRAACDDHRPALEEAGLALTVDVPAGPVWVNGDPVRLAQVVGNLLTNAAKFTDRGGTVAVRLAAEGGRAVVSVRDTGVGIEAAMLPRLFEPFSQADRSLERTRGGLGLGLALVKGLVELHGGEVRAESAGPGQGATFTFWLPLEAAGAAAAAPAPAPPPGPSHRRVLIVEDNRDAADSLRMLLELAGHEVAVAYAGPEGIARAHEFHPDVVLCDLGLPGLSGFEVARALRGRPGTSGPRLVAVSGYGRDEDQRRAREAGFDAVLVKPVPPAVLTQVLG